MSGSIRLCYDSTDPNAIPATADLVLQYLDGANQPVVEAWAAAAVGRFAGAKKVGIAVLASTNAGTILDVEQGDALPSQAPYWVQMRRAAGVDPTVYVNLSNWAQTRSEFNLRGIPEPHWLVAAYDNDPTIPAGAIGKQFANAPLTGANFDLSAIAPLWPGVDTQEEPMTLSLADKRFHAFQMILTSWGRNPNSEQELNDVANVIQDDGQNRYDVAVSVYENPNGIAYRAQQAALAAGGVVPPHEHTGSVTVK